MDCENNCWTLIPPDVPPPPPLPAFLSIDLILRGVNSSLGCDLCDWAYPNLNSDSSTTASIPLSSLLVLVALFSALAGAGLTVILLSIKR